MDWSTFNILSMQRIYISEWLRINIPGLSIETLDLAWLTIPRCVILDI